MDTQQNVQTNTIETEPKENKSYHVKLRNNLKIENRLYAIRKRRFCRHK